MTRAIIADPDLPAKSRVGRAARPCIGLNEGCIGRLYTDRPMWCSVNPGIRDPELAELAPAATPGRVVVVGGGVAGLEAARGAALRGHGVVVFERRAQLGGRARLAGARRGRERWARYLDWLRAEAEAAGAELRTGVAATVQAVLAEAPDAVILATGSDLRPAAALAGPVPAIDVDVLLERGFRASTRFRRSCSTMRVASSRRRLRSDSSRTDSRSRSPPPIRWSARESIRRSSRSCSAALRSPASS